MMSQERDCRRRKCTNGLHEGVCRQTSTPHKSRDKMKRKTKNWNILMTLFSYHHQNKLVVWNKHFTEIGKKTNGILQNSIRFT